MRVLMVNSHYYLRGGSERCFFDLTKLLESHGHEVIPFSTLHPNNVASHYSKYFVSSVDFPSLLKEDSSWRTQAATVERVLYSREARQKIAQLISDVQPDIAHLHNIAHEISPSILSALSEAGIPIVQTLHDYKLLCPNTSFVSNGTVCEACKVHRYHNVVLKRCKRGSLPASILAGLELGVHKALKTYERNIDAYISPSRFLASKLYEYRIQNRIENIPNFIDVDGLVPDYEPEDYFVFAGRLSPIKGIGTILRAMEQVRRSRLYIAGDGELRSELEGFAAQNQLDNVTFLGHLTLEALMPLVQKAQFSIVASEVYENYPMAAVESLACGTPVIGTQMGGIPEIVKDGETGLIFQAGNEDALAEAINAMLDNPRKTIEMGRNGRRQVEKENHPAQHYHETMRLYAEVLGHRRKTVASNAESLLSPHIPQ